RAAAAVLLSPAKVTAEAAPSLLPLGPALSTASGGGVVLGGPTGSAAATGLVGMVRADATARAVVSTADVADLTSGRVALVLALAQARTGKHGAYGAGPSADAPVPPAR
ncbi:MAG TPA: copper transporter, partial [Actinomycetes bacterium]